MPNGTESNHIKVDFAPEFFLDLTPEEKEKLAEENRAGLEKYKELCQMIDDRQRRGVCIYCGGEFVGLFGKKCKQCGKAKSYKKTDEIGSLHF